MRKLTFLSVLIVAFLLPVWASEPGQPLDCSDIVIMEPGLSISTVIPFPCPDVDGETRFECSRKPSGGRFDNTGGFFYSHVTSLGLFDCGEGTVRELFRHAIYRFQSGQDVVIAYLDQRCGVPGCWDDGRVSDPAFDDKNGRLYIGVGARLNGPSQCDTSPNYPNPPHGGALCSLGGFATLTEVLQSTCEIDCGGGDCVPTASKEKGRRCSDGIDNDCDGAVDGADLDCF